MLDLWVCSGLKYWGLMSVLSNEDSENNFVPRVNIVGVFIEDGAVCTYFNFDSKDGKLDSGDLLQLPRGQNITAVIVLGTHESLAEATAIAKEYLQRLCKWDGVDLQSVKLFGHNCLAIEEEVSQIGIFATQGIEGPLLNSTNTFDMLDVAEATQDSQSADTFEFTEDSQDFLSSIEFTEKFE